MIVSVNPLVFTIVNYEPITVPHHQDAAFFHNSKLCPLGLFGNENFLATADLSHFPVNTPVGTASGSESQDCQK
jgi:hypothetical protein